ncbi:MAG: rhodanese-like domain-containing protein [Pyrinomonadaceae bacterium]
MKIQSAFIKLALVLFFANPAVLRAQESCAITEDTPMTVSSEWLKDHIGHNNLVLLHVGDRAEYEAGHIPGARFISSQDVSLPDEDGNLSLQLPSADDLRSTFEKYGISNDTRIILYFGKDWVTSTTRIYFTLDYLGLKKNTSILDGGMPDWVAAGNSLTKDIPSANQGSLRTAVSDQVATSDWIATKLKDPGVKIIDARTPGYYDGSNAGNYPRPGHISGAKNIPFNGIVDEKNKLKDETALRKMFTDAGVKPYDTVVTYCHIGQQASLVYFAARSLGYKVKLYDGSFEEWSRNESLAVEDPKAGERGTTVSVVSPKWANEHANDENVRVLDVRLNVYDYFAGHIPNAVHLADAAMRAPREGYPTQYLESFLMGRMFSNAGIRKGDKVVVYSDGDGVLGATMMAYLLERYGHREIMFVDGGFRDYKMSHAPEQKYPAYKPERFDSLDNRKISASVEDIKNSIGKKGVVFIDARPPDVYRGETKIWTRNGHIPGAVNIPWKMLVEENNSHKFKPAADLRKVYSDAGIKPTDDIIVYCGTSREASLEYMILKHVLKFPKVRLYEGSWAEYSNHPDLAVETGTRPERP